MLMMGAAMNQLSAKQETIITTNQLTRWLHKKPRVCMSHLVKNTQSLQAINDARIIMHPYSR
jgi:hypothetical protein